MREKIKSFLTEHKKEAVILIAVLFAFILGAVIF